MIKELRAESVRQHLPFPSTEHELTLGLAHSIGDVKAGNQVSLSLAELLNSINLSQLPHQWTLHFHPRHVEIRHLGVSIG